MKAYSVFFALLLSTTFLSGADAPPRPHPFHDKFDDTTRFIFYSVLEGCYEDGLSNQDIDQILLRDQDGGRLHFIYACPICGATVWGLEAYRSRPEALSGLKLPTSTFGPGLTETVEKQLFSTDLHQRLLAINLLEKSWIERRMTLMNLSKEQRDTLLAHLEEKRKDGMRILENFRHDSNGPNSLHAFAPGYVDLDECAVCNGAVGKLMKLPEDKSKPDESGSPTPVGK